MFRTKTFPGASGGQLCYAFEPDESTIGFVANFVGEDLLAFASDYNHSDSKFPHTVRSITSREDIAPALLAKIMGENAARLYGL